MAASIIKNRDEDHLLALSICHYVLAGLNALSGCIPLVHVTLGLSMLAGAFNAGPNPPPAEIGWFFLIIGGSVSLISWTFAALNFFGGRCLARHTHYRFCFAVCVINCLQVPQGTALAVFTIIVLSRESVEALFAGISPRERPPIDLDDFSAEARRRSSPDDGAIREGRPDT